MGRDAGDRDHLHAIAQVQGGTCKQLVVLLARGAPWRLTGSDITVQSKGHWGVRSAEREGREKEEHLVQVSSGSKAGAWQDCDGA